MLFNRISFSWVDTFSTSIQAPLFPIPCCLPVYATLWPSLSSLTKPDWFRVPLWYLWKCDEANGCEWPRWGRTYVSLCLRDITRLDCPTHVTMSTPLWYDNWIDGILASDSLATGKRAETWHLTLEDASVTSFGHSIRTIVLQYLTQYLTQHLTIAYNSYLDLLSVSSICKTSTHQESMIPAVKHVETRRFSTCWSTLKPWEVSIWCTCEYQDDEQWFKWTKWTVVNANTQHWLWKAANICDFSHVTASRRMPSLISLLLHYH